MARILLVDGNSLFRDAVVAALLARGYEAHAAADGRQALEKANALRPHLVVLDLALPGGLDGLRLIEALRRNPAHRSMAFVLLTAERDVSRVVRARQLGVHDYLLKSAITLDELDWRIRRRLESPEPAPTRGEGSTAPGNSLNAPPLPASPHSVPPHPPQPAPRISVSSAPASSDAATQTDPASNVAPGRTGPAPSCAGVCDGASRNVDDRMAELRDAKPLATRSEIHKMIAASGEIRALSPAVAEIQKLVRSRTAPIESIASVLRRDQAMALKVLRLANSAAFARGGPVESIDQAVLRIGLERIGHVALSIGVVDRFDADDSPLPIDPRRFWEHSIATGLIAARIARATRSVAPDFAFTAGLLHDAGRALLSELLTERYRTVAQTAVGLELPLETVERRLLGINHAEAMDRALHTWGFQRDLIDPIVFHHLGYDQIRTSSPNRVQEVATLALADRIAHTLMLGDSGNEFIYPTGALVRGLGVMADQFDEILQGAADETADLKLAMLRSDPSAGAPARGVEGETELEKLDLRTLFLSDDPKVDATTLLFPVRREHHDDDAKPQVGVIHVTAAASLKSIGDRLREAERDAGSEPLPLLLLSDSNAALQTDDLCGGREYRTVILPAPVKRIAGELRVLAKLTPASRAA